MKKFFASLTFIAFLFISQMQLVHALDMERMEISSSHNHAQIEMEQPIFCKTTAENNQSHCAKELVPDKALFEKKKNELSQVNQSSQSFSYFGFVEDRNGVNSPIRVSLGDPPEKIYQRSVYVNMIGIMKSLN